MVKDGLYKLIALSFCILTSPAVSEEVDINSSSLKDLIDGKWYEVELIVFKSLNIRDTNEQLIVQNPPIWPTNIQSLSSQENDSIFFVERDRKTGGDPFCLSDEKPDFPDGLGIILSQGYEPELLNDFDATSSQVFNIETISLDNTGEEDSDLTADIIQRNTMSEQEHNEPIKDLNTGALLDSVTQEITNFEDYLRRASFLELADYQKELLVERKLLDEEPDLVVTHHLSWLQNVPERGKPLSIMIPRTDAKLAGYVRVTIGRYLHFEADLWMPMEKKDDESTSQNNHFAALRESRRMRSNELHYLDHPAFGIITKISPYSIESDVAQRWLGAQNPEVSIN